MSAPIAPDLHLQDASEMAAALLADFACDRCGIPAGDCEADVNQAALDLIAAIKRLREADAEEYRKEQARKRASMNVMRR